MVEKCYLVHFFFKKYMVLDFNGVLKETSYVCSVDRCTGITVVRQVSANSLVIDFCDKPRALDIKLAATSPMKSRLPRHGKWQVMKFSVLIQYSARCRYRLIW